jgi:chemotaxis response regulator CheB
MAEPGQQSPRQLVVIGSSAGGIDALSTLVSTLSPDFPAPIIVAQHLDPFLKLLRGLIDNGQVG